MPKRRWQRTEIVRPQVGVRSINVQTLNFAGVFSPASCVQMKSADGKRGVDDFISGGSKFMQDPIVAARDPHAEIRHNRSQFSSKYPDILAVISIEEPRGTIWLNIPA